MSRIGKLPVAIPNGVEVKIDGQNVAIKGPKGNLSRVIHSTVTAKVEDGSVVVTPVVEGASNFHGLTRSLINNMVIGVSEGYSKSLKLVGVGYRAQMQGKNLQLSLGYSHPIVFEVPEGLDIKCASQTDVVVSGADKEAVGQAAANIRSFRKPEPYHGKGVRYADERIVTKVGKAAGKK